MMSIPGMKCTEKSSFLLSRTFKAGQLSQDPVIRHRGDDAITRAWGEYDFESEARDERQQKDRHLFVSIFTSEDVCLKVLSFGQALFVLNTLFLSAAKYMIWCGSASGGTNKQIYNHKIEHLDRFV